MDVRNLPVRISQACRVVGQSSESFCLRIPHFAVYPGSVCLISGPSGCGKTTLMEVLGLLSPCTSCRSFVGFLGQRERNLAGLSAWRRSRLRRRYLGYVPQTGALIPYLKAADNILLSARLASTHRSLPLVDLCKALGIESLRRRYPAELSVGQRQRVAIARALIHRPEIVLADEPTGALDPITAEQVKRLFVDLGHRLRAALIVVSHDVERFSACADLHYGFQIERRGHATISTLVRIR